MLDTDTYAKFFATQASCPVCAVKHNVSQPDRQHPKERPIETIISLHRQPDLLSRAVWCCEAAGAPILIHSRALYERQGVRRIATTHT